MERDVGDRWGNWIIVSHPMQLSIDRDWSCLCECVLCGSREFVRMYYVRHKDNHECSECKGSKRKIKK